MMPDANAVDAMRSGDVGGQNAKQSNKLTAME
jgi:hypothetical protein